jgi:hypothetical protein
MPLLEADNKKCDLVFNNLHSLPADMVCSFPEKGQATEVWTNRLTVHGKRLSPVSPF